MQKLDFHSGPFLDLTKDETDLIDQIVARVMDASHDYDLDLDRLSVHMDLLAVHTHGCPLDLARLVDATPGNLMHDVGGIILNLDRDTGELKNSFLPRFAKKDTTA